MNKLIAFLIGFIIGMSCLIANADMYVSTIGDPQFISVELSNGQKIEYWETRVLISTAKHASGVMPEENIIVKVDEPLPIDNAESDDVLISVTWESDYVSSGYNREEYLKNSTDNR